MTLVPCDSRLLFPDNPELVPELFELSGVADTLRPQQLSLTDCELLCNAFVTLRERHHSAIQN